jgi:hypothetical protein
MEKDAARPAVEVIRELMDEPGYYWTPHEFVYALADTDPAARTIGPNAFSEPLKESFSKAVVAEGLRQELGGRGLRLCPWHRLGRRAHLRAHHRA